MPAAKPSPALITINFPENVEIKTLVEYVSQRLGINILYDEQVGNKRITVRAPAQIPADSLMGLLESALKIKGLALVDADPPGWKRIVVANDLLQIAKGGLGEGPQAGAVAVMQVFTLQHADPKRVEQVLKPFLTQPGGNTLTIPELGLLVVTDYATSMKRVGEMVRLIDQPRDNVAIEFVPVQNLEAAQMAQQVQQLLLSKQKAQGVTALPGGISGSGEGLDLSFDARTNRVVVVGSKTRTKEAIELIKALDVSLPLATKAYALQSVSAERIDRLAKELIGPVDTKRIYRSAIDREGNTLIVTAPAEVHQRIASLQKDLDRPVAEQQSPIRFYRLTNSTAAEVLQTIRSLETGEGLSSASVEALAAPMANGVNRPLTGATGKSGITRLGDPNTTGGIVPENPAPGSPPTPTPSGPAGAATPAVPSESSGTGNPASANANTTSLSGVGGFRQTIKGRQATVTADPNTNSIIVVAEPELQRVYEQLIRMLDRRRPQVLVEMTIATMNTSNNYSFGVEVSKPGTVGGGRVLNFSSFGLSDVNRDTGALTLKPGLGFNGAIVGSDIADIIVRALSTSNRVKLTSAPKILVNDNATGTLSSVDEAPFTSINTSNSVTSTTSFGGYATAGTTINVTPHISEGDHLQLEYSVTLNNFTGAGVAGIPPPRQTSAVQSKVTVPDGDTIIVGGLNRKTDSKNVSGIPILDKIPILEYLVTNRSVGSENVTLFVFIRPVILRDDQFEDLKFFSQRDLGTAELPKDFPSSEPVLIR